MRRPAFIFILFLVWLTVWPRLAQAAVGVELSLHELYLKRDQKVGYVSDLDVERRMSTPRPLLLPPPVARLQTFTQEDIFTDNLSKEFTLRYEEKFGRTEAEQMIHLYSNPFESYRTPTGTYVSAAQTSVEQREFGEFMVRRLGEWHMDNYIKTDRQMRPVYELKQKISRVEVAVAPGVSFQANYSFSGNSVDMEMKNPYVDTKARVLFGRSDFLLSLYRGITPTFSLENHTTAIDGTTRLVARKGLSASTSVSLQGLTYFKDVGYTLRERSVIAGLGVVF